MFVNRKGKPYTGAGFSKHFANAAKRAGCLDITFHDLRRHVGAGSGRRGGRAPLCILMRYPARCAHRAHSASVSRDTLHGSSFESGSLKPKPGLTATSCQPSLPVMRVVCPLCNFSNPVVPNYKPGTVLACRCGAYLEFVGEGEPGRPVSELSPKHPTSRRPPPESEVAREALIKHRRRRAGA